MNLKHLFILMSISLFSCEEEIEHPNIIIHEAEYITHNSAVVEWERISEGTAHKGFFYSFCMNRQGTPTLDDEIIQRKYIVDGDRNRMRYTIAELEPNTTYFIRFAITSQNPDNVWYSNQIEIKTLQPNTFTDIRDNEIYQTVTIGSQEWFAENLKYKVENNLYDLIDSSYGRIYNYEVAKGACPEGWRLPSDIDWKNLELNLGLDNDLLDELGWRGDVGIKIKLPGDSHWTFNTYSTNESGFSAVAGVTSYINEGNVIVSDFRYQSNATFLSSSFDSTYNGVLVRQVESTEQGVKRHVFSETSGASVRCVRNND